jgi:hypothetical protein
MLASAGGRAWRVLRSFREFHALLQKLIERCAMALIYSVYLKHRLWKTKYAITHHNLSKAVRNRYGFGRVSPLYLRSGPTDCCQSR